MVTLADIKAARALAGIIATHRGNILDVVHDRFLADPPIGKTEGDLHCGERRPAHLDEIVSEIEAKGYEVKKRA